MREEIIKIYKFNELSDSAKERAREWWRGCSYNDNDWCEFVYDKAEEQAGYMGITMKRRQSRNQNGEVIQGGPCIWWSGFSNQGDGACFEGTWRASNMDISKVADGWGESDQTTEIKRIAATFSAIAKKYPNSSFTVTHSGHYSHENCTEFEFEIGDEEIDPDSPVLESYRREDDSFLAEDPNKLAIERWVEDFPFDDLKKAAKDLMRWIYRSIEEEHENQMSDEFVDESIIINEYEFTSDGSIY